MYQEKVGYIDKIPQFRYAVYSKTPDKQEHELECSADSQDRATRFFEQYKTWGLPDTAFYLVDWQECKLLGTFKPIQPVKDEHAALISQDGWEDDGEMARRGR